MNIVGVKAGQARPSKSLVTSVGPGPGGGLPGDSVGNAVGHSVDPVREGARVLGHHHPGLQSPGVEVTGGVCPADLVVVVQQTSGLICRAPLQIVVAGVGHEDVGHGLTVVDRVDLHVDMTGRGSDGPKLVFIGSISLI